MRGGLALCAWRLCSTCLTGVKTDDVLLTFELSYVSVIPYSRLTTVTASLASIFTVVEGLWIFFFMHVCTTQQAALDGHIIKYEGNITYACSYCMIILNSFAPRIEALTAIAKFNVAPELLQHSSNYTRVRHVGVMQHARLSLNSYQASQCRWNEERRQ